jgi:hypothetical protein
MALSDLAATVQGLLSWYAAKSQGASFRDAADQDAIKITQSFEFGTASEQANQIYAADRTISAATPVDDIDLFGSLTNFAGETIQFTSIKAILVYNQNETELHVLYMGGNTGNALFRGASLAGVPIYPGGLEILTAPFAGIAVSNGVNDILRLEHGGGTQDITYTIVILGVG